MFDTLLLSCSYAKKFIFFSLPLLKQALYDLNNTCVCDVNCSCCYKMTTSVIPRFLVGIAVVVVPPQPPQSNTIASWLYCFVARRVFSLFLLFTGDAARFLFADDGFARNKDGGDGDCCDSIRSKSITLSFVAASIFLLASAASRSLFARLSALSLPAFGFGFSPDDAKSITIGSPGFSLLFLLLSLFLIIGCCGSFSRKSSKDAFIAASLSRWYLASKSRI